ncbi:MAG: hypothetical protein VB027_06115 [Gordonibacter sp.]|nr:hypothetical protein [Gordonibacter sp.]
MDRLTIKHKDGTYTVDAAEVVCVMEGSYAGSAIERLAAFEDAIETVELQLAAVSEKLENLKARGSLRTATAQQLLAQKLTYSTLLRLMNSAED